MATRLGLYGNREMGGRALASARLPRGEPEKEALACCWYGKGHSERHPIQHLINRSASHQTPTISFNLLHNKQHNSFSCREKTPLFIRQVWDQLKLWKRQRKNKANSFHMDRYYTGTVKRSFHKHTHTHTFTPSALRSGSPEAFQFSQVYYHGKHFSCMYMRQIYYSLKLKQCTFKHRRKKSTNVHLRH